MDIAPLARLNGWLINVFFQPAIRFTGWLVFLAEAWVVVSLFLGLFSRLGGLVSLGVSAQLMVGLAGISNPPEWEWSYILLVVLSLLMLAFAPGRVFGLDALLRPRLATAAGGGRRLAWLLLRLT